MLVGLELFVRPALRALQGAQDPGPRFRAGAFSPAPCVATLRATSSCGRGSTTASASSLSGQESHMIVRAAAANALVHVPRGDGELAAGSSVRVIRLTVKLFPFVGKTRTG